MSDPDVQHAREALAKLEHLVVQDIFLTETAWHADVVLPASAHAEKWGTFTNTNRQVQIGAAGDRSAGRGAAGLGADPGDRPAHRPEVELHGRVGGVRRDGAGDAVAQQHHLGAAGARGRRHLSVRCAGQARQRDHLRQLVPDRLGPRQDRAGRSAAARRAARRAISAGADHRPPAGALAHRLDDAARLQPRRAGAGGDRRPQPARDGQARRRRPAASSGCRRGAARWC